MSFYFPTSTNWGLLSKSIIKMLDFKIKKANVLINYAVSDCKQALIDFDIA